MRSPLQERVYGVFGGSVNDALTFIYRSLEGAKAHLRKVSSKKGPYIVEYVANAVHEREGWTRTEVAPKHREKAS